MINYVGETTMVLAEAKIQKTSDPDVLEALDDTDGVIVTLTIYELPDSSVDPPILKFQTPLAGCDDVTMSWSTDLEHWTFTWETVGLSAGTFDAKVEITGPGSRKSWEYGKIKLTADKEITP